MIYCFMMIPKDTGQAENSTKLSTHTLLNFNARIAVILN
jgi:hypothetical protein